LPEQKDLGLLRIDFNPIKTDLKPNPKRNFEKIKKTLPKEVRSRIEISKVWLQEQISLIEKPAYEPDPFVQ